MSGIRSRTFSHPEPIPNPMKNQFALKLKRAADKYEEAYRDGDIQGSAQMLKQDHEDLMSIAWLIEDGAKDEVIAKAMWKLDTLVRDVIPDEVYYRFCK